MHIPISPASKKKQPGRDKTGMAGLEGSFLSTISNPSAAHPGITPKRHGREEAEWAERDWEKGPE